MRIALILLIITAFCNGQIAQADATTCSLINVTGVAFGMYDPSSVVDTVSSGTFEVDCSGAPASPIVISLDQGLTGTFAARSLTDGPATLQYNLYRDAGDVAVWGDGTAGTATLSMTPPVGTSGAQTIYGKIPARQIVAAGGYSDSITMTVTF